MVDGNQCGRCLCRPLQVSAGTKEYSCSVSQTWLVKRARHTAAWKWRNTKDEKPLIHYLRLLYSVYRRISLCFCSVIIHRVLLLFFLAMNAAVVGTPRRLNALSSSRKNTYLFDIIMLLFSLESDECCNTTAQTRRKHSKTLTKGFFSKKLLQIPGDTFGVSHIWEKIIVLNEI